MHKNKNIWLTSDVHKIFERAECKEFVNYIENYSESTFELWINKTTEFKVIQFDDEVWELSKCSCRWWHKELKCSHVIVLACRLKKASYIDVAYSASCPIES